VTGHENAGPEQADERCSPDEVAYRSVSDNCDDARNRDEDDRDSQIATVKMGKRAEETETVVGP
jgi:hypothetical protein